MATTELPEEIIHNEILTRLPIKSVVRFKSVSKSWLYLFSNPQFVKNHYTRAATENLNDYDSLITWKYKEIFMLTRYKATSLLLPLLKFHDYKLIGSVNGIVCLRRYFTVKMLLWNPAIHQAMDFILPLSLCREPSCIGLGFDPVNDDYKVVVCYFAEDFRRAYVYSSKSDSWTELFVPYNVFPEFDRRRSIVAPTSTIVENCPYWKFTRYSRYKLFKHVFAVKFDVGCNEFELLPSFCSGVTGGRCQKRFKFVNVKDSLTLMVYEVNSAVSYMVEVYSLDEEEGFWVPCKMYDIRVNNIIYFARLAQGFEYGGETVFSEYGKFICYDDKTDTIRHIGGVNFSRSCFRYNPSLVFLQGMKSVLLGRKILTDTEILRKLQVDNKGRKCSAEEYILLKKDTRVYDIDSVQFC